MSLKGVPTKIGEVASEEEIHLLFDVVKSIDDSLGVSMASQQGLKKCSKLVDYLKDHSLSRRYMFQLRKCDQSKIDMQNCLDAVHILREEISQVIWELNWKMQLCSLQKLSVISEK